MVVNGSNYSRFTVFLVLTVLRTIQIWSILLKGKYLDISFEFVFHADQVQNFGPMKTSTTKCFNGETN